MLSFETAAAIANWASLAAPRQCREDARQEAWVGILQAQAKYDPSHPKGASELTYARRRAQGAVLDYLRSVDPLGRGHRRQVSQGETPQPKHIPCEEAPGIESHEAEVIRTIAIGRISIERLSHRCKLNRRQRDAVRLTVAGIGADARTLAGARKRICAMAA